MKINQIMNIFSFLFLLTHIIYLSRVIEKDPDFKFFLSPFDSFP